ncbi:hypothetical protein JN09_000516 [Acholeplasma morum]|uniref:hypothetical protein n=1 Tax=Paracholeplasma morum TaxID=264637 RepID=UPI0019576114|nr:hypothetical protein [Paracholeplasma morum]MBM7453194.1 hypothetical protein [Paracholeplasma morum]
MSELLLFPTLERNGNGLIVCKLPPVTTTSSLVNYPPLNRSGGFLSKPMYPPVTQ